MPKVDFEKLLDLQEAIGAALKVRPQGLTEDFLKSMAIYQVGKNVDPSTLKGYFALYDQARGIMADYIKRDFVEIHPTHPLFDPKAKTHLEERLYWKE